MPGAGCKSTGTETATRQLNRSPHRPALAVEPSHGPNRASSATPNLQREANEAEAALAHQLVQVDEPLHVRDALIAANMVDLKIVAAGSTRTDGLDAEHADTLLFEPARLPPG